MGANFFSHAVPCTLGGVTTMPRPFTALRLASVEVVTVRQIDAGGAVHVHKTLHAAVHDHRSQIAVQQREHPLGLAQAYANTTAVRPAAMHPAHQSLICAASSASGRQR